MNKPLVNVYIQGHRDGNDAPYVFKTVNLVWGTDIFQQVCEENTKYVIKWTFDLRGKALEVPKNCIFEFDGGMLKNGSIQWDNTKVLNLYGYDILQNISESGVRYDLNGFKWNDNSTTDIKAYIGSGRTYSDVYGKENKLIGYESLVSLERVTVDNMGDYIIIVFTAKAYQKLTEITMSGFEIPFNVNRSAVDGYVVCTSKNKYVNGTWPITVKFDINK